MSDFGAPGPSTPPPSPPSSPFGQPPGAPPPPPPPASSWSGAPPATPYGMGTQVNPMIGAPPATRPRPAVTVAALLLLGGGVLMAVGSFVTWFSVLGESFNGFSGGEGDDVRDGPVFLTLGLLLVVGGVLLLVMRRVLGIAIAGIVIAAAGVLAAFADLSDVLDLKNTFGVVSVGAGLYLCVIGGLVALGGAIAATAKRRR